MCLVFCKPTVLVKVPLENSYWCFWCVNYNFTLPPYISSTVLTLLGFHSGWSWHYSVHDNLQPCLWGEVWNSFKSGSKVSIASRQVQSRLPPAELLMLILILAVAVITARWPLSPIPNCENLQGFVDLCECLLPRSCGYVRHKKVWFQSIGKEEKQPGGFVEKPEEQLHAGLL